MTADVHVSTIVTAWITYVTAIGMIYAVGQKSAEFLNKETIQKVSEFSKDRPITTTLNAVVRITLGSVDRLLKFRKDGLLYRPDLVRSIVVSLVMLALLVYPLRNMPAIIIMYAGLTIGQVFEYFGVLSSMGIFAVLLLFNAVADFLSFSKTRTLMESFARSPSPVRIFPFVLLDIILCVIVAYMVAAAPTFIFEYGYASIGSLFYPDERDTTTILIFFTFTLVMITCVVFRRRVGIAAIAFVCVSFFFPLLIVLFSLAHGDLQGIPMGLGGALMLTLGPFFLASVTGLGIALISALTAVVTLIGWGASRIEAKGIWKVLNFEVRPMESSAIVGIVVFTLIYWPVVLI
jgi:hypothetical protein